jgi:predicted DNA-binding transcriptional regulator YafY
MIHLEVGFMPVNKKQLIRLVKLAAVLKENRPVNAHSFADDLKRMDMYENINIACGPKTIIRDIKTLRNDFNAPIEFDPSTNSYYLASHGWNFSCPVLQDEDMLAAILGARLAEDIFPEPVKSRIRRSVDSRLGTNNPDFLDTAFIHTLIMATGVKVEINPKIFMEVFNAWQNRNAIDIEYGTPYGKTSKRLVEPHVLAYFNEAWYIKGICLKSDSTRVFAIHRITSVETTDKTFTPDSKIISSVASGNLFDYDIVRNVKVWSGPEVAPYLAEKKRKKGETVTQNKDGSIVMFFPEIQKNGLIKWILSDAGYSKILEPRELAVEIAAIAEKIAEIHK